MKIIALIVLVLIVIILVKLDKAKQNQDDKIKWKQWQQEDERKQKEKEEDCLRLQIAEQEYCKLQTDVLAELGFDDWNIAPHFNEHVSLTREQDYEIYDKIDFFREHREKLEAAKCAIIKQSEVVELLKNFLEKNNYTSHPQYNRLVKSINDVLNGGSAYKIQVNYTSADGNHSKAKELSVTMDDIHRFQESPWLLMTTDEIRKMQAEKEREFRKVQHKKEQEYQKLKSNVSKELGFKNWDAVTYFDQSVIVHSRQAINNYDEIKFFKENREALEVASQVIERKKYIAETFKNFLKQNPYTSHPQYDRLVKLIHGIIKNAGAYRIRVDYISSAGTNLETKELTVAQSDIDRFQEDPTLLMTKGEFNKYLKAQEKEAVNQKQHEYYERINHVIDYANEHRASLVVKGNQEQLDSLITQLFERTVHNIKKIKTLDSEEWNIIGTCISSIQRNVEQIVGFNQKILAYYDSPDFRKIKETCESLMSTQREFNEYINEKVQSISQLFGTRVVRGETVSSDEYNYIRPYKKTITPFTAEVSASVFASAENNPLDYVVKKFYQNKRDYPEQIRKLCQLVEELETLKDAKQIIENYKADYQQYLRDVPAYIMENDEAGFYSRLGFATIDESVLNIEYKFSYTSNGGMAQRSFPVPMTEETIAELIKVLESKLTASAFAKEQRTLMTKKLRDHIKARDNFTCRICGNSTHVEPNLLLEIDHIIPVSKGGCTTEDNLQTLCWKCNRAKSDKILN